MADAMTADVTVDTEDEQFMLAVEVIAGAIDKLAPKEVVGDDVQFCYRDMAEVSHVVAAIGANIAPLMVPMSDASIEEWLGTLRAAIQRMRDDFPSEH